MGPLIFTDPEFTLRAALDGLGVAYMFEEHVADYLAPSVPTWLRHLTPV
jgi:DNA-binding transcriptional LysR family regulator